MITIYNLNCYRMRSGGVTRFVHTQQPKIYHPNGLLIDREHLPSGNATSLLINHLLTDIFTKDNPCDGHKCNKVCTRPTQIMIGFPNSEDLRSSCPEECMEIVDQYEKLLQLFLCDEDEELTIVTIVFEFLPCSKVLEILSVSIYL